MSLNNRTMKYVPTTAKNGTQIAMGFAVEAGDLEVISSAHISDSLCDGNRSFVGVVTRTPHDVHAEGAYKGYSESDMVGIRLHETIKAANIASYNSLYLLSFGELADVMDELIDEYSELLDTYRPDIIFTYSPFDSNREHIISMKAILQATKKIAGFKPKHIYAANFDGDLGGLFLDDLVILNLEDRSDIIKSMLSVYVSAHEANEPIVPATTAFDLCALFEKDQFVLADLREYCLSVVKKISYRIEENLK